MPRYAVTHQTAAGNSLEVMNLFANASRLARLYCVTIASDASPDDQETELGIIRSSSSGAGGTSLSEVALDPLDVSAAAAASGGTYVTPPSPAGSYLMRIPLNQRVAFLWMAAPDSGIWSDVTDRGFTIESINAGATQNLNMTMQWQE